MTTRDVLRIGPGGPGVPFHTHDGAEVEGAADLLHLRVDNLLAGTITGKEVIIAGGADGILRSSGFSAGTSGWAIFGDGSAEFNDIVVRGVIIAGTGSEVDWSYIQNVVIENADITSISFDKITAATNTASLTIGGSGFIRSSNYSAGVAGFQIEGDGDAEFNDVTIRGTVITGTGSDIDWDHVTNVSIENADIVSLSFSKITAATNTASLTVGGAGVVKSSNYSAGTAGWQIEGDGDAEFNNVTVRGTIHASSGTITGTLTMGSSGLIRTNSSGERIELSQGGMEFYASALDSAGELWFSGGLLTLTPPFNAAASNRPVLVLDSGANSGFYFNQLGTSQQWLDLTSNGLLLRVGGYRFTDGSGFTLPTAGEILITGDLRTQESIRVSETGEIKWYGTTSFGESGRRYILAVDESDFDSLKLTVSDSGSSFRTVLAAVDTTFQLGASGVTTTLLGTVALPSGTTINGSTAWHAGNDGSGSGLDADTVDGSHASAFATSGHGHSLGDVSGHTLAAHKSLGVAEGGGTHAASANGHYDEVLQLVRRATSREDRKLGVERWDGKGGSVLDLRPIEFYITTGDFQADGSLKLTQASDYKTIGLGVTQALSVDRRFVDMAEDNIEWNAVVAALIAEVASLRDRINAMEEAA